MKTKKTKLLISIIAIVLNCLPQISFAKSTIIGPTNTAQYQVTSNHKSINNYKHKTKVANRQTRGSNFFEEYQVLAYAPLLLICVVAAPLMLIQ